MLKTVMSAENHWPDFTCGFDTEQKIGNVGDLNLLPRNWTPLTKPIMILGKGTLQWENNVHRIKKFEITADFCWIILVGNVKSSRLENTFFWYFSLASQKYYSHGETSMFLIHDQNEP